MNVCVCLFIILSEVIFSASGSHSTTNLQIVLNTQKYLYLNQATQKNTCQIFLPKKIPQSKISNPKKSFYHPRHLKSGVPPMGTKDIHIHSVVKKLSLAKCELCNLMKTWGDQISLNIFLVFFSRLQKISKF